MSSNITEADTDLDATPSPSQKFKRMFLLLTLSTVGLSGISLAFFLIFGGDDDRGVLTAASILLVDVFLIAGFFAKHAALRITSWVLTLYMFVSFLLLIWVDNQDRVIWRDVGISASNCLDYYCSHGQVPQVSVHDLLTAFSLSGFIVAGLGVAAALVSLAWGRVKQIGWLRVTYWATLTMFAVAALLFGVAQFVDLWVWTDTYYLFGSAALVLAGTGLAIVITSALINNPQKVKKIESLQPAGTTQAELTEVDFKSEAAREAFYEFMKEYEYRKKTSFLNEVDGTGEVDTVDGNEVDTVDGDEEAK